MPDLPSARAGRTDPKPRHVIGAKEPRLAGARPDRRYVFVHKVGSGGVDEYEEAGFVVERHGKEGEGPRIPNGRKGKPGEPIEFKGHVLMSIAIADAKAAYAEGQREADETEKQIIKQRRGVDQLRGIRAVRDGDLMLEAAGADWQA